ncbi:MAG: undecaprenyl-diphosphate phosphatase [Proteobacteria bacterium]|nr:undecaprenyl-diphosphate phosphatase [Pseudomonadota bacterium]
MDVQIIAIILGIVEGVTEFLPISSTGHLILVGNALQFLGEKAATFEIVIQSGAILAVLLLYRQRFIALLDFSAKDRPFHGQDGALKLALACAPALLAGFLFSKSIKQHLFNPTAVAIALIVGGIIMLVVERRRRAPSTESLEALTLPQVFLIGCFQCLALWPGISRSGATIVGAMLLGVSRAAAAEFSFLIAIPILLAATGYELLKSFHALTAADLPIFALGFLVSFISATFAVKGFIKIISHWSLIPFAIYRIILGAIVLSVL